MKSSTSDLLIANCDEFIYYDDLVRKAKKAPRPPKKDSPEAGKKQEAIERVVEVVHSVEQDYDPAVGLDAQAGDPPRVSRLQRGLLRLREFLGSARRHQGQGADRTRVRREPRELQSAAEETLSLALPLCRKQGYRRGAETQRVRRGG